MPDLLDAQGLQVKTFDEIQADLETGYRQIYGADINLDQNSPDGQLIGILAQMGADIRELIVQVNNGFNPDRAVGRVLDERVPINLISRIGGTYTIQPVSITVNATVTLQGLDEDFNDPNGTGFTVQDNAGNEFILIDTDTLTAGTHSLNFRAKQIGQVETVLNTITNQVTVVLGVTAVNNPSAALEVGVNQETDAQLRVRRQRSVALNANGYLNGLLGTVLSLDGVTDAALYENVTNDVDADGIPAHGIWLIAEGGASSDIAQAIYEKKSYGANMKGAVEVNIETASGAIFVAKFDRPTAADLYIRFEIQQTVDDHVFNEAYIKQYIADNLSYNIGQSADTAQVTVAALAGIAGQGGGGVPINVEISDDGVSWADFLETAELDEKWTLDVANITITIV